MSFISESQLFSVENSSSQGMYKNRVKNDRNFLKIQSSKIQNIGLGRVYFFQPGSGFGPYFLARFGSGKKCFYSGLPRVKIIIIRASFGSNL